MWCLVILVLFRVLEDIDAPEEQTQNKNKSASCTSTGTSVLLKIVSKIDIMMQLVILH